MENSTRIVCLFSALSALCAAPSVTAKTYIVIDPQASIQVQHAASELANDIRKAAPTEDVLMSTSYPENPEPGVNFIQLGKAGERLEPESFTIQSEYGQAKITGADNRGLLYGVYAFSERVLGIDPLEYWTGKKPPVRDSLQLPNISHQEPGPEFGLRGYFDNDNDHLANWRGRKLIVELDTWKEMIDSLARMRYNYIDIHDLLGRPEYYLRDYYLQMTDYHTDLELVEQVIDYAHEKGLLVQIPMTLGWEFRHIDLDQVCLTEHHDLWMETFEYYLSETPIGKADLFVARPRHPVYDWQYKCPAEQEQGIAHGPLLQRVFDDLGALIDRYSPGGQLVTDLWQEGRPLWVSGDFAPDRNIQILWADTGYAEFGGWPDDLKGYPMGIYIHAGVWHNQVVQDPYPARIGLAFREATARGMTHNAMVNGQSFKPFILNLEAAARAMWDPSSFDGDAFYSEWATRYFGADAADDVVLALEHLHQAHNDSFGYRDITKYSQRLLKQLQGDKPFDVDRGAIQKGLESAQSALKAASRAETRVPPEALDRFDDQVLFPIRIYLQNLEVLESLAELNPAPGESPDFTQTRSRLKTLLASLEEGSRWKKWDGWYRPENFRIHTPPLKLEDLEH